jgi:site-specific DNA recombinase
LEKLKKVAIYVRVSTEEQAEHGYSIDAQRETLKSYCNIYGYEVFKEYIDRGVSGKSMKNRFELQQMLKDAEQGLFDEVLVWKINRLARKNMDLLHIVDFLDKHNVAFSSFSEKFDTSSAMGKFALQMMGAVGELERNTIVDNVKMGMKQRASQGRHNGKVPLGYRIVKMPSSSSKNRDSKIEIVEEEAIIVRKIFEWYASGRGYKSLANELNHEGYTTKAGNPFSICAVKDILTNPFFVGKIRYNQFENWSERRRKGRNQNPIEVDGEHEAIISQELWDKVKHVREKKSKVASRTFDGEYLLTGLIRCPKCGAAMVASRTKNKMKDGSTIIRTYYSCGNFRSKGSAVCSANSVRKLDAEKAVFGRISKVLAKPKILQAIIKNINERKRFRTKPLQRELETVVTRIAQAEERKRRYFDLYEIDQIDKELFSGRLNELNQEIDKLHSKKSELKYELKDDNSEPISYDLVRALIERFEELLMASSFEERKTILHLIIQKISVNDKKEIDQIVLTFDESTEKYFLREDSSANQAEGSFAFMQKKFSLKKKVTIVI